MKLPCVKSSMTAWRLEHTVQGGTHACEGHFLVLRRDCADVLDPDNLRN
jgi:hypothetical protein